MMLAENHDQEQDDENTTHDRQTRTPRRHLHTARKPDARSDLRTPQARRRMTTEHSRTTRLRPRARPLAAHQKVNGSGPHPTVKRKTKMMLAEDSGQQDRTPPQTSAESTARGSRCPEVGPRTSIGTPPRRTSQPDLWTPTSRRQNDSSQHDGDPRSHRISKSRRKTRSAPKSKFRSDLWTPNSLKQTRSKQPLDTDDPTRTQLYEAKAPSRERKNRRRPHRKLSKK